jgi:hypothetical protein
LGHTLLSPGGYAQRAFFDPSDDTAGPTPGVALNILRPEPTTAAALLSLALVFGLTFAALTAARTLNSRTQD